MRGDHCSRCGIGVVESKSGRLCPQCLMNVYKGNQAKVTIRLCIKITPRQREKFREAKK